MSCTLQEDQEVGGASLGVYASKGETLFSLQCTSEAYDLIFGHVDPGIGVTLCRESAEPRRDDTGDEDSLAILLFTQPLALCKYSLNV